jgi:hypothetical protein
MLEWDILNYYLGMLRVRESVTALASTVSRIPELINVVFSLSFIVYILENKYVVLFLRTMLQTTKRRRGAIVNKL